MSYNETKSVTEEKDALCRSSHWMAPLPFQFPKPRWDLTFPFPKISSREKVSLLEIGSTCGKKNWVRISGQRSISAIDRPKDNICLKKKKIPVNWNWHLSAMGHKDIFFNLKCKLFTWLLYLLADAFGFSALIQPTGQSLHPRPCQSGTNAWEQRKTIVNQFHLRWHSF